MVEKIKRVELFGEMIDVEVLSSRRNTVNESRPGKIELILELKIKLNSKTPPFQGEDVEFSAFSDEEELFHAPGIYYMLNQTFYLKTYI